MASSLYLYSVDALKNNLCFNYLVFLQMHADDFRQDRYGVVSGLKDGGYSDDMTLAAIAGTSVVLLSNFLI